MSKNESGHSALEHEAFNGKLDEELYTKGLPRDNDLLVFQCKAVKKPDWLLNWNSSYWPQENTVSAVLQFLNRAAFECRFLPHIGSRPDKLDGAGEWVADAFQLAQRLSCEFPDAKGCPLPVHLPPGCYPAGMRSAMVADLGGP